MIHTIGDCCIPSHKIDEKPKTFANRFCRRHLARIEDALGPDMVFPEVHRGAELIEGEEEHHGPPESASGTLEEACTQVVEVAIKAVLLDIRNMVS